MRSLRTLQRLRRRRLLGLCHASGRTRTDSVPRLGSRRGRLGSFRSRLCRRRTCLDTSPFPRSVRSQHRNYDSPEIHGPLPRMRQRVRSLSIATHLLGLRYLRLDGRQYLRYYLVRYGINNRYTS